MLFRSAKLNKGAKVSFNFPANYNTALLVIEGSIKVNEKENISENHFVLFENEGELFTIEATENTIVFNNLVNNIEEYNESWEVPAMDSWHSRFF